MVNGYVGYTESERRGTSPQPPFKGGKERSEGGMLSLQRGEERSEAHEALTFGLLLDQAKSNGKNALNNKRNE